jgi:Putative adhesin
MTRILKAATAIVTLALATLAQTLNAQERYERDTSFNWQGKIAPGNWLRVHNINGAIDVSAATGAVTTVRAEKRWRRGDPKDVRVEVVEAGSDIIICALWDEDDTCDADGYNSGSNGDDDDDSDVSVHFTIALPKGVNVNVSSVNGAIDVREAAAEVIAETVNGRIDAASTGGPVQAETVNGAIQARMVSTGAGNLAFETVNGSVTVEVPDQLNAEVEMETVNGELRSDFPLTMRGRFDPRHIRATIGKGGRRLELKTVNGSVELRKTR